MSGLLRREPSALDTVVDRLVDERVDRVGEAPALFVGGDPSFSPLSIHEHSHERMVVHLKAWR